MVAEHLLFFGPTAKREKFFFFCLFVQFEVKDMDISTMATTAPIKITNHDQISQMKTLSYTMAPSLPFINCEIPLDQQKAAV